MKKRNIIRLSIITILLVGSLAILQTFAKPWSPDPKNENTPSCSKNKPASNSIIWESLSQKFAIS